HSFFLGRSRADQGRRQRRGTENEKLSGIHINLLAIAIARGPASIGTPSRHDLDCCRPGARPYHRREIRTAVVLHPVRLIDLIVQPAVGRLEGDLPGHSGSSDLSRLLSYRSLIPARVLAVVSTHIKPAIDGHRPDPGRGAVRRAVISERRDVQVIDLADLLQFVPGPSGRAEFFLTNS